MKVQAKTLPTHLFHKSHSFQCFPFFKRLFDILFSTFALIALSPLYILLALAIKCSSPGPIFYKSERVGENLTLFYCLKFRTMVTDADEKLQQILKKNPTLKKEWSSFMKLKKDPRITPIGHFLRKTSLDELPQFFNVLRGELSVVGPRPYAILGDPSNYINEITGYLGIHTQKILSIKPGITGLWQTSGRNDLTLDDRIKLDAFYAEKKSLLYDFFLILKTIPVVLFSKGAY